MNARINNQLTTQRPRTLIVLGGGYAGRAAATRYSSRRPGDRIVVVERRPTAYQRIREHQQLCGRAPAEVPLADLLPGNAIHLQAEALSLDLPNRTVRVRTDDGHRSLVGDAIVVALGSSSAPLPGAADHPACFTVDGYGKTGERREAVAMASTIAVVGGGLSGIETAAELAEKFPDTSVRLVSRGRIGDGLGERAQRHVRTSLSGLGVELVEGRSVTRAEPNGVVLEDDSALQADVIVSTVGFSAPRLLADIDTKRTGFLPTDEYLRHCDGVWVAGDAADVEIGGRAEKSCALAIPMGAYTGDAAAAWLNGDAVEPFSFALAARFVGLGRCDGVALSLTADGAPGHTWLVGRPAAWVKEQMCRIGDRALRMERLSGLLRYRWKAASGNIVTQMPSDG